MTEQEKYMKAALKLAQKAADEGEVPVGAVVVATAKLSDADATDGKQRKTHCTMQKSRPSRRRAKAGRLAAAPLRSVRYARAVPDVRRCAHQLAYENRVLRRTRPEAGSCGSMINLFALPYNHQPALVSGVLEQECADILRNFFRELRKKRKEIRKLEKSRVEEQS